MAMVGSGYGVVPRSPGDRVGIAAIAALVFLGCVSPAASRPARTASLPVRAELPAPQSTPPRIPARLLTGLAAGLADHAGAKRAGLMCLPNGNLRVRDFVYGETDFNGIVSEALAAAQPAAAALVADGTTLSLKLVSIDAKLCARAWGVFWHGDRVSLSGKASMTFDWVMTDMAGSRHETSSVALEIARADAATTDQILRRAVDRLLAIIVTKKAS